VDVRSYPLYAALTVVKTVVRRLAPSHRWNRRPSSASRLVLPSRSRDRPN
jgi:hypothetical protein